MLYYAGLASSAGQPGRAIMRKVLVIAAVVIVAAAVFAFRLILLALGSVIYLYFLPGLVARDRCHPRRQIIQIVCGAWGWLILPWGIGLWIALKGPVKRPVFGRPVLIDSFDD